MARHLRKNDIRSVVDVIRGWHGSRITWELVCDSVEMLLKCRPSRQTLQSHDDIKTAFQARKAALRGREGNLRKPSSLAIAAQRIEKLERELDELRRRNSLLLTQFVTWQYNAYKRGLLESDLNSPLPRIDRERSEPNERG